MSKNSEKIEYALALSTTAFNRAVKLSAGKVDKMSRDIKKSSREATNAMGSLSKSIAGVGIAGGLAATGGLLAFNAAMRDAVDFANEQEDAEIRLAGVLKATGQAAGFSLEELKSYASELQNITTVGDETTIAGMSILATFKEIKGDQFKLATKAAIDMATVMKTDLKSAMVQVGKALNDPAKGMAALSRSGVSFTQAQKDQVKALQESGNIMAAQNIILEEMQGQFGGVADALRGTFKGEITAVANTFGDLKEEMGFVVTKNQFFIEGAKLIEQKLASLAGSIKDNRGEWMVWSKESALAVLEFAADFGDGITDIYTGLKTLAGTLKLSYAGTLLLGQGFQYLFEQSNRLFGDTDKAEMWAKAQADTQKIIDDALAGAAKSFDDANKGLPALEKTTAKIRELKEELSKFDAKEVDPATDLLNSTKAIPQEMVKIGDTWHAVTKDMQEKGAAQAAQYQKEMEEADKRIAEELAKTRAKLEEEIKITYSIRQTGSGGGGATGFNTGGPVPGGWGGGDRVRALLEPGEFVLRKEAVRHWGMDRLASMNRLQEKPVGLQNGGPVQSGSSMAVTITWPNGASNRIRTSGRSETAALLRNIEQMGAMAS